MNFDILMCPLTAWVDYYEKRGGGNVYTDAHIEFDIIPERFIHTTYFKWTFSGVKINSKQIESVVF